MKIGSAIKSLRKQKFIMQHELAERIGMSVNAISLIETNETFPRQETIELICKALGIPVFILYLSSIDDDEIPEQLKTIFGIFKREVNHYLKNK